MLDTTLFQVVKGIWPTLVILSTILILTRIYYLRLNNKSFSFYKEILTLLFIVYLIILYKLLNEIEIYRNGVNLLPFVMSLNESLEDINYLNYIIANIIIFIPFGYFISSYIGAKRIGSISVITLITGIVIEFIQLQEIASFNIDNILEYLIGAILGFSLYIGLTAIKKHLPGLFQNDFLYNIISISIVVLVVLYFLGVISFGWLS
ncbi:MAG TPA: VanZ family protein [Bacilli bacterium]|nr:VanZ family protein [Bacilli bacterium]